MNNPLCIEPMKINKIPEGKEALFPSICASGEYFAQLKKDGYWYQFEKDFDGNIHLWSRNVSVQTGMLTEKSANVPEIIMALEDLPKGTVIIGEIYYPGKRSKDVTPIMGALPELAIERQNGSYGKLHYYVHDIIYYDGHDLTKVRADVRYDILRAVYFKYELHAVYDKGQPLIELAERVDDNIQEAVAAALAAGEEGMVLKKRTAPYTPGKRPVWDTIKIKKTDTCDAIIIGYCEPTKYYDGKLNIGINYSVDETETGAEDLWPYWYCEQFDLNTGESLGGHNVPIGKYEVIKSLNYRTMPVTQGFYYGWPTALEIGAYDKNGNLEKIGTVSSGLTNQMKAELKSQWYKYNNKVCELAGMEKDKAAHTLRHFHFKRLRDDKNPQDCTIEEIFR